MTDAPSPAPGAPHETQTPDESTAAQGAEATAAQRTEATTAQRTAEAPAPEAAAPRVQLRTPRQWVALALGVAVLFTGCVLAGRWQWNRHVDRDAQIAVIEANYASDPVPIDELLDGPGDVVPASEVWRRVTVSGTYEADKTVLLRNRPVESQAAFHVLVPFVTDEGTVIVVNRGWIPYGSNSSTPDALPAPPGGEVELTLRLRADEPAADNGAPPGQVQAINTAQVLAAGPDGAAWADGRTYGGYGALAGEDGQPAEGLATLPVPDTDPRSHLSYAFQWWVFAVGGVAGFVVLIRRERRDATIEALGDLPHPFAALGDAGGARDGDGPLDGPSSTGGPHAGRSSRPGRRGGRQSAEEIEDALIDSSSTR